MKNRNEYGNGLVAYVRYYADYASERFNSLDHNRKVLLIVGTASVLVIIVVSLVFLTGPHYTPLYTNLNTQDAASIAAYLKNQKIPYQIADDGSTIMVPDAQKYQIRLDLANNNLPSGGNVVGFESFDQTHFGETETEEQVRYIAALQGELERTIGQIDGVEGVRVHLVQPADSLFVQDQKDATASVLLKLTPGYSLQDSQVLGITHLVCGAVEGLKPANVTVIDTSGNILSNDASISDQGQMSTDQIKIKQDYENQLAASIQSMLERVVGPGKVIVRANATLNFDQVQIDTENYGDKQVQSDHTIQTTSGNTTAQGAPGTASNVPIYPQISTQGGAQAQTTDKTTNYDVDTQTEHQVVAPGQIKQLSLSVVVDGQLDPVQQKQIEDMVSSAAGIIPARGDQLTVAGMPFNNQAATQAQQEIDLAQREHTYLNGFYILLALIFAFLVVSYARKSWPKPGVQSYAGSVSVEDLLADKRVLRRIEEEQGSETQQVLEQLREQAKSKPDETLAALKVLALRRLGGDGVPKKLSGKQKAAVLLLSLGDSIAAEIIKSLREDEVEQIFFEIASLGKVSDEMITQVSQEFYDISLASGYINYGDIEHARDLLEKALGAEKAGGMIKNLTASLRVRPFDFARKADPAHLINYIQDENPQTIALILAHLDPEQAAILISELEPDKQAEVAYRMAVMDSTSPRIIREVEQVLEKQLSAVVTRDYTSSGGVKAVVEILNRVDRATEKKIIEDLEDRDSDLAEQVKKLLFVFEDIVQLDDRYVQIVLREVDTHDLAMALKGATDSLSHKIEHNISKRAADNLKEEIQFLGPVRIRDVEDAQQKIVSVIRVLEDQGQIIISRGDDSQLVV